MTAGATGVASAQAPACAAGTNVQTSTGPVCGIVANGVSEWLGVPYAQPPVGALRWAPPKAPAPWTAPRAATQYGNECRKPTVPSSGEDCLYLNVWKPATGGRHPVLVHIHGGGFFGGNGNGDNTLLANTGDEVVVSMNYRLGIYGFLANSAFGAHSGDYGLQDQQAALQWVQDNVAKFGGDPNNVTIYGESAGGSSVCDQIASPTAKGLFTQATSTSGEYNTLFGGPEQQPRLPEDLTPQDCKSRLPTQSEANGYGDDFAKAVGCDPGTAAVASCLRDVSVADVDKAAYTPGDGYQYGGHGTIAPTINGTTLPRTLRQALKRGKVNRVPVIAGVARDENLVASHVDSVAEYQELVQQQYGALAPQVLERYPIERFASPWLAWRKVAADSNTVCPAITTARALAMWMPVHEYEVDDGDATPYQTSGAPLGAKHVADWYLTPTSGLSVNQQVLQNQEIAEVTNFGRTGDPTAPGTPNWPRFNAKEMVMSLAPGGDSELVSTDQISTAHQCGFWNKISPKP
jgi:para-nitrobenzyl esterase